MSDIENELIKTAKFKSPKDGDRQDHLAALARACYKLDNDTFDEISEPAADWVNKAIEALNNKEDLPEFPDLEDETQDEETDESEEDNEAAEAEAGADEPGTDELGEDSTETNDEGEEPEEKPKAKTKIKAAPKQEPPPKRKNKPSKAEQATIKTRYDDLTGEKDRFGVIIGTKTHDAVVMYQRGTTSKELKDKLGGRYYNILAKLTEEGHLVERTGVGVFTLIHKDDIPAKPAKKAKK